MSNVNVLLTRKQVAEITGLALETVKAYRAEHRLPEADVMYERTPLWREQTSREWMMGRGK